MTTPTYDQLLAASKVPTWVGVNPFTTDSTGESNTLAPDVTATYDQNGVPTYTYQGHQLVNQPNSGDNLGPLGYSQNPLYDLGYADEYIPKSSSGYDNKWQVIQSEIQNGGIYNPADLARYQTAVKGAPAQDGFDLFVPNDKIQNITPLVDYDPSAGDLGGFTQALSIASMFVPGMQPLAAVLNTAEGLDSHNMGQTLSGVMGLPGIAGPITSAVGSGLSDIGVPSSLLPYATKGTLSAGTTLLSGGSPTMALTNGLASGAGSYAGGQVSDLTKTTLPAYLSQGLSQGTAAALGAAIKGGNIGQAAGLSGLNGIASGLYNQFNQPSSGGLNQGYNGSEGASKMSSDDYGTGSDPVDTGSGSIDTSTLDQSIGNFGNWVELAGGYQYNPTTGETLDPYGNYSGGSTSNPNIFNDQGSTSGTLDANGNPTPTENVGSGNPGWTFDSNGNIVFNQSPSLSGTGSGGLKTISNLLKQLGVGSGGSGDAGSLMKMLASLANIYGAYKGTQPNKTAAGITNSTMANRPYWGAATPVSMPSGFAFHQMQPGVKMYAHGGQIQGGGGLSTMAQMIRGSEGGQSDRVPIQASPGEYMVDADTVSALGDGNSEAGAKELDKMREHIRAHKRSAPPNQIPPPSKGALAYLRSQ